MLLLRDIASHWLDRRDQAGLAPRTISSYRTAIRPLIDHAGSIPARDFGVKDLASYKHALLRSVSQGTAKIRFDLAVSVVRHAQDEGMMPMWRIPRDVRRMRGSPPFRRVYRNDEIARMLSAADEVMRTLILLALNLGYGQSDCARLRPADISGNLVDARRHKTGGERRGWLWPETLAALRNCPPPFVSRSGGPVVTDQNDYVRRWMRTTLRRAGVEPQRRGFYSLRRTYRTAVDDHADRPAIDLTMGHSTPGMGARYVAWISDERIRAVSDHARRQILGKAAS